jgi:LPS export ABC transporter protein LptC
VVDTARKADKLDMMNKVILYVAAILPVLLLAGCGTKNEIKAPAGGADSTMADILRPDQQIRNARIYLYNGAMRTTDVLADYIEKYEKQDSTLAWKLQVHFFDSTGREISNLVADSGLIRERTNTMVANGHVVVIGEDSSRLETEQLFWNGRNNKIETNRFVRVIQEGDTINGQFGLEADQRLTHIKIKAASGVMKDAEEIAP